PAVLDVVSGREAASAALRVVLASLAVLPAHADDAASARLVAVGHVRATRHDLADDRAQLRHALADERQVVDARPDGAAGRDALPRLRRLPRPHHGQVLAGGAAGRVERARPPD